MTIVNITKQPLFGTVYWNGEKFIYTPFNPNGTDNDFFIYTKTVNGITTTYAENVSPNNTAPVTNNITLTANATTSIIVDINNLSVDNTKPFGALKFKSVTGQSKGTTVFNDSKIYYTSNYLNYVETLSYVVTDGQFDSTGTVTISVINGFVNPPKQLSLNELLNKYGNDIVQISNRFQRFNDLYTTLQTYYTYWDSIDYAYYNSFSNNVLSSYQRWDYFNNNKGNYLSNYNTLIPNSATWNDTAYKTSLINNELQLNDQKLNEILSILPSRYSWDAAITRTNQLTSAIENDNFNLKLSNVYNTVTASTGTWDNSEITNYILTR